MLIINTLDSDLFHAAFDSILTNYDSRSRDLTPTASLHQVWSWRRQDTEWRGCLKMSQGKDMEICSCAMQLDDLYGRRLLERSKVWLAE